MHGRFSTRWAVLSARESLRARWPANLSGGPNDSDYPQARCDVRSFQSGCPAASRSCPVKPPIDVPSPGKMSDWGKQHRLRTAKSNDFWVLLKMRARNGVGWKGGRAAPS
jgi:hypothetical protein